MGPTASGKTAARLRSGRRSPARPGQRRFGPGLSRHGYRHGQARCAGARTLPAPADRYSSIPISPIPRPNFATMRLQRSGEIIARRAGFPCWSAEPASISARWSAVCRHCHRPIRPCARRWPRRPSGSARRICTSAWPALDPVTAARLDCNDSQRVQRALEVIALSGKPLSGPAGRLAAPIAVPDPQAGPASARPRAAACAHRASVSTR